MALKNIPRTVVGGSIKVARVPVDAALKLAGRGKEGEVVVDRAEAAARDVAGTALGDEELRRDAAQRREAADTREEAIELREAAEEREAVAQQRAAQRTKAAQRRAPPRPRRPRSARRRRARPPPRASAPRRRRRRSARPRPARQRRPRPTRATPRPRRPASPRSRARPRRSTSARPRSRRPTRRPACRPRPSARRPSARADLQLDSAFSRTVRGKAEPGACLASSPAMGARNSSRTYLRRFLERAAGAVEPGQLVLDAGAGRAQYRGLFAHARYETADFMAVKGKRYRRPDYVCDLVAIPVEDGRFDHVVCTQVLEHVPDRRA